jgi:hypothetical protein
VYYWRVGLRSNRGTESKTVWSEVRSFEARVPEKTAVIPTVEADWSKIQSVLSAAASSQQPCLVLCRAA